MAQFTLNLEIDGGVLDLIIAAQENIILAKPVGNGTPNVIWLSLFPFPNTAVTWEEAYGLYAATTEVRKGAVITPSSTSPFPALVQHIYPFIASAQFGPPQLDTKLGSGDYVIRNDMPFSLFPALTFGLHQNAMINGNPTTFQPVNAATVIATREQIFTPSTTVFVWLQSNLVSRTVVERIVSRRAEVTFSDSVTEINLKYNPNSGIFTPV